MDEETFRKRLYQFFEENEEKSFTVKHFESDGSKRSSLFQIIKRSEDGISGERKVGYDTKAKIMTKDNIAK